MHVVVIALCVCQSDCLCAYVSLSFFPVLSCLTLPVVSIFVSLVTQNKRSPANANKNAQQLQCVFESQVKQSLSQSPEGARRH